MILEKSLHERTLDKLVKRLEEKYPTHRLLRNMDYMREYGGPVLGQVDLLRINPAGGHIMYEVKTGKKKYVSAKRQYHRFKEAFPTHNIKGVYVHPRMVKRLR